MCLSGMLSHCTIEYQEKLGTDQIRFINEGQVKEKELDRIKKVLSRVRDLADIRCGAKVVTKNNFPKSTGIASSASGLSAVTMAAAGSAELDLSEKELSELSRLASGSACRSIPDGFVEWIAQDEVGDSYARTIFSEGWWKISDVIAIVTKKIKKTSSTKGHALAESSPFYQTRLSEMAKKVTQIKQAIKVKDFTKFGHILETEALNFHAVAMTSAPPLLYWEPTTLKIMRAVQAWRKLEDLEAYFTIDAGPTVHVICQAKDEQKVAQKLNNIEGVDRVEVNRPAHGARFSQDHLF